ncbi:MAG: helix-turn-helix transcriptional regulator [Acidobacteriota bacterium]
MRIPFLVMGFTRLPATILRRIGARIYQYRNERNWTQEELAAKAGCTHGYISELERGVKSASIEAIYGLAETLNVKVSDLLRGTDGLSKSEEQREKLLKQALAMLERLIDLVRQALRIG